MKKVICKGVYLMKDREKELKYELYLIKRQILELKKRQRNLGIELNNHNESKTRSRKLNKRSK